MEPTVTVCVTNYNHEKYIKRCIDSLLNQVYKNIIIEVYDDCSIDKSIDILKSYGDKINLTIYEKNRGVSELYSTLNHSIENCKSDFWYYIDGDDSVEPDYINNLMIVAKTYPEANWVYGGLNIIDENDNVTNRWDYHGWPLESKAILKFGWKTCSVPLPHHGIMGTKFLQDNKIRWSNVNNGWGIDTLFCLDACLHNPSVIYVNNNSGHNWRVHSSNQSFNVLRRINLIPIVKDWYEENVEPEDYLDHKIYTDAVQEYKKTDIVDNLEAAKDYLIAVSILNMKKNFVLPSMFTKEDSDVKTHINVLDESIRNYCDRSLGWSKKYEHQINWIINQL